MVYLSYSFASIAITVIHNGTLPMSDYVNIEIEPNRKIPSRIKNKLRNVTLVCQLTGERVKVTDGSFSIRMNRKSSFVLTVSDI